MQQSILLPSLARTVTGAGAVTSSANRDSLRDSGKVRVFLKVSAISGVGATMTARLLGTVCGVEVLLGTFPAQTAVGEASLLVDCAPQDLKVDWTMGGTTPSITFEALCVRA